MPKDVIVMVADEAYAEHCKSLLVNFHRQGDWEGDFCIIAPGDSTWTADLEARGIDVLHVPDSDWDFMVKFYAFTPYFHKWDRALCVDIDIMVQGNIKKIFDGLGPQLPSIMCNVEDGPILGGLKYWDSQAGDGPEAHPEVYERLEARFPHVTERMYNMAFIFYEPASMPPETMDELRAINEEFKEANPTNADQMLVNLHLYSRIKEAGKDYFCFFGFDYPENRIKADSRGWRGDEVPSILHYCRWQAPWIVKEFSDPAPGGYLNHRLDRECHELYSENLAAFDEEFPRE